MKFQFSSLMRKYNVPYFWLRPSNGRYDDDGVWVPANPERVQLKGHFQPISDELKQDEPGRYTAEDRMLFTVHKHEAADVIEYQGEQYTITAPDERDYRDINQYVVKKAVKKVVAHDSV